MPTSTVNLPYAITMLSAIAVCSLMLRGSQRNLAITAWQKLGIGLGAFCGAMIGAKLPFVLSDWDGMLEGTAWFSHGKTIMCGIVGGYFGVEFAKLMLDVRIKTGDTFAVPVPIAVGIGRIACFVGGCCYGTRTRFSWGVAFPLANDPTGVVRHPTQLYEAAFHFSAAAILYWMQSVGWFKGQRIKLYLLTYFAYRFATEFIRPEPRIFFGLTGYQWACLLWTPLFIWLWQRDAKALRLQHQQTERSNLVLEEI